MLCFRMSIWKCPICTMMTATSPTAPSAVAAGKFCCVAMLTAAGRKPPNSPTPDSTFPSAFESFSSLCLLLASPWLRLLLTALPSTSHSSHQVFLCGLPGHPGGSRGVRQRPAPGPMALLYVPAAAAVRSPTAAPRLEPQAAGVLCQRQWTGVCKCRL